ncbi:hypothetical protein LIA77_02364 [Sarocladium implicatum]|nr:hypothetical protein LIA77_02364 [Sarocladium implicatum]
MAPLNYQQQHDRHLEDGLASHGEEKLILKEELAETPQLQASSPPKARKMNLRRFTVTFGVGLLVGFGLVTASRTRPNRALCPQEVHASNEHEMKALVEQTKDDASALSEMLRCASPETFHKLVSVYFPDRSKPEADDSRSAAIGKDETWLLTAWEKLVKRQDDGTGNPATPSDTATEGAGDAASGSATVTDPVSSDPASNDDPSVTQPGSDPEPTSSDLPVDPSSSDPASDPSSSDPVSQSPPNTDTDAGQSTTVQQPPSSSTSQSLPESTSEEPATSEEPSTSESVAPETTSTSTEESSTSTEEAPSTTSSSTQAKPQPSTSSEGMSSTEEPHFSSTLSTSSSLSSSSVPVPPSSSSSSFKEPTSTLPKETSTEHDEPDRPSKTTIHVSSSAVRETITSVNEDGGVTTITSTSWVAVDPPKPTDDNESDPSLQDAGLSLRANVASAAFVSAIVAALLIT